MTLEQFEVACKLKQEANKCFKNKDLGGAVDGYTKALGVLNSIEGETSRGLPEEKKCSLLGTLLSNRGLMHLKLKEFDDAVTDLSVCLERLETSKNDVYYKALYRRAQAYAGLGDHRKATSDYKDVLESQSSTLNNDDKNKIQFYFERRRKKQKLKHKREKSLAGIEEVIPSLSEQRSVICEISAPLFTDSSEWYLVEMGWWKQWLNNEEEEMKDEVKLPPISNQLLLKDSRDSDNAETILTKLVSKTSNLRPELHAGVDFEYVAPEIWSQLTSWYESKETPVIKRICIAIDDSEKPELHVYPTTLTAHRLNAENETVDTIQVRSYLNEKASAVKSAICGYFHLGSTHIRIRHSSHDGAILDDDQTLAHQGVVADDIICVEVRLPTGRWPSSDEDEKSMNMDAVDDSDSEMTEAVDTELECASCFVKTTKKKMRCGICRNAFYCNRDHQRAHWIFHKKFCQKRSTPDPRKGKVGIANLGNTCYMNSALQCLSHTPELTLFFLTDAYLPDINKVNPIGFKGVLAQEYATLMKELWFGYDPQFSPSTFRRLVCKFHSDFQGNDQHDAQELLSFLLDGLHEDLNRVIKKPFIETKASDGKNLDVASEEAWANHLKRNQSRIISLFQGQYKSSLVCSECDKISVTFDPFLTLSIPIPDKEKERKIDVQFYLNDAKCATTYTVSVSSEGTTLSLKEELSKYVHLEPHKILPVHIKNCRIRKPRRDGKTLSKIGEDETIVAFEVIHSNTDERKEQNIAQIRFGHCPKTGVRTKDEDYFGVPFVYDFPKTTTTGATIYEYVRQQIQRFCKDEIHLSLLFFKTGAPIANDDVILKLMDRATICIQWDSVQICALFDEVKCKETIPHKKSIEDDQREGYADLDKCLQLFTAPELLGEDWKCPRCKVPVQASKKIELWRLPDILVIHLKRFKYNLGMSFAGCRKLNTRVKFPIRGLDLSKHVHHTLNESGSMPLYDLYGIVNHHGRMGFGHYTAVCDAGQGTWLGFDDEDVSVLDEATVEKPSHSPYILFYRRRTK